MEMNKGKKSRVNHAVESGFAFSIREFTKGMAPECIGKTKRGRLNNSAFYIKRRAMAWADSFPRKIDGIPTGFTPAVREVFKAIVWRHLMDRRYSVFSFESLAREIGCHRDTVRCAINFLREKGLVQYKTGRGWGQKERRHLANQYVANFWIFLNAETGMIITPPYSAGKYDWRHKAEYYRNRLGRGENPPSLSNSSNGLAPDNLTTEDPAEIPPSLDPKNRQKSAGDYAENPPVYTNRDKGSSPDATPSPRGSGAPPSPPPAGYFNVKEKHGVLLSFVSHTVERWDEILTPNPKNDSDLNGNYEPHRMSGLIADALDGLTVGRVENHLTSEFLAECEHGFECDPINDVENAKGVRLYVKGKNPNDWYLDRDMDEEEELAGDDWVRPVYGPKTPVILYRFRQDCSGAFLG